jgi:hypothetical protein
MSPPALAAVPARRRPSGSTVLSGDAVVSPVPFPRPLFITGVPMRTIIEYMCDYYKPTILKVTSGAVCH